MVTNLKWSWACHNYKTDTQMEIEVHNLEVFFILLTDCSFMLWPFYSDNVNRSQTQCFYNALPLLQPFAWIPLLLLMFIVHRVQGECDCKIYKEEQAPCCDQLQQLLSLASCDIYSQDRYPAYSSQCWHINASTRNILQLRARSRAGQFFDLFLVKNEDLVTLKQFANLCPFCQIVSNEKN